MGSIQEIKMNGLSNSDDAGITVDLTEAQIDEGLEIISKAIAIADEYYEG